MDIVCFQSSVPLTPFSAENAETSVEMQRARRWKSRGEQVSTSCTSQRDRVSGGTERDRQESQRGMPQEAMAQPWDPESKAPQPLRALAHDLT